MPLLKCIEQQRIALLKETRQGKGNAMFSEINFLLSNNFSRSLICHCHPTCVGEFCFASTD